MNLGQYSIASEWVAGGWLFLSLNLLGWIFCFTRQRRLYIQSWCGMLSMELRGFTVSVSGFSCAKNNTNLCRNAFTSMWRVQVWSLRVYRMFFCSWCWKRVFVNLLIERRTRWAGMVIWVFYLLKFRIVSLRFFFLNDFPRGTNLSLIRDVIAEYFMHIILL